MKRFSIFNAYPNIVAEISLRKDGPMKAADDASGNLEAQSRKEKFLATIGVKSNQIVRLLLVHGNTIVTASKTNAGTIIPKADGLITTEKNLFLSVTVADCLPIFLYEPDKKILSLLHAGWKGLDAGIITEAVSQIKNHGGSAENILVGIGPSIGPCHYTAYGERVDTFTKRIPQAVQKLEKPGENGETHSINLQLIAKNELELTGIMPEHIEIHPDCTACHHETYFSYRADKTDMVQPMMAVFGIMA